MRVEIPNQISVKIGGIISRGVKAVEVSDEGKLIFTLTDGSTADLGSVIGPAGPKGETGPAGPAGPAGAKGDTGAAGASILSIEKTAQSGTTSTYTITMSDGQTFEFEVQSDKGEKGDKGDTGEQGPKGPQGEQGPAGIVVQETEPTGPEHPVWVNPKGGASDPGITGKDGTTFTPSVSASGDLSWTNDGGKENPETVNIKGPQGEPGEKGDTGSPGAKGDTGATPNLQIGTVTTLPAGSDATASVSGTAENPLLNLGIPKGADGSGGPGGTDLSLGMTSAAVGQLAKITAVDANGKPTAWAALNRSWTVKETYPLKDMTFPAEISIPQDADSMLNIIGTDITADKNTKIKLTLSTASSNGGYGTRWSFTTELYGHGWGSGVCMMLLPHKRAGTSEFTMRRIGWAGGYDPIAWPESTQSGEKNRLFYRITVDDATLLNPDTTANVVLYTRDALC